MTGGADCAEFRFTNEELHLDLQRGRRVGRYQVRAELAEAGTDITSDATKDFEVQYTKMKLTTEDKDSKYFKPGLPFVDQVRALKYSLAVIRWWSGSPNPAAFYDCGLGLYCSVATPKLLMQ